MTTIFVRPHVGSSTIDDDGESVAVEDTTLNDLRSGKTVTADALTLTGIVGAQLDLRSGLTLTVNFNNVNTPDEVAYENGAFVAKYASSTLDFVTGAYTLTRPAGFPARATVSASGQSSGDLVLRYSSWEYAVESSPVMIYAQTSGVFHDPATVAAQSVATDAPVVLRVLPPQTFANLVSDQPSPGGTGWKNTTYINAKAESLAAWTAWMDAYIAAGGVAPQTVVIDQEDYCNSYNIAAQAADPTANYEAIFAQTPRLVQLLYGATSIAELVTIVGSWWNMYFNNACEILRAEALDEAYTAPILERWPSAQVSFYGTFMMTYAESLALRQLSTYPDFSTVIPGTHAANEMYGWIGNAGTAGFGANGPYGTSAYQIFRWEIGRFSAMRRSYPTTKYLPWIAPPSFSPNDGYGGTAQSHTREKIFHTILRGADGVLYFNFPGSTAYDDVYMDAAFTEIRDLIGNRARVVQTTAAINCNDTTGDTKVVSGLKVGDSTYLWRCSFDTTVTSVTADGVAVTIPFGECGVWVTRSTATPPVFVVA